jgi:hypothetical protein
LQPFQFQRILASGSLIQRSAIASMNPTLRTLLFRVMILGLVLGAWCPAARAQFQTNIVLDKPAYLTYEPVTATVTIKNLSGSDVVMGGPNGLAWLNFDVTDPSGNRVAPVRLRTDETIVFKAGASLQRSIRVSDYVPFSEYGSYGVMASVYHPPSQQYYASNRLRVSFTDVKPFWEQSYGVPLGLPGAGQIRRYALCLRRDTERTFLYSRVLDDKTGLKLSTFCLGTCIMVADPQVTIDSSNKLHVLYMAIPHVYAHATINTQGRMERAPTFHKEVGSDRPQLVVQKDQSIGVMGGVIYDPAIAEAPPTTKARSIKDRPPGL